MHLNYPPEHNADELDKITSIMINKFRNALNFHDIFAVCNTALSRSLNKYDEVKGTFAALYYSTAYRLLINAKSTKYSKPNIVTSTPISMDKGVETEEGFEIEATYGFTLPFPKIHYNQEVLDNLQNTILESGLNKKTIKIITLRYYDKMSIVDIAKKVRMKHSTVHKRIQSGLRYLRLKVPSDSYYQDRELNLYRRPHPIEWAKVVECN
jgi:RNA polymerase sigma factor (sigma-70 family)